MTTSYMTVEVAYSNEFYVRVNVGTIHELSLEGFQSLCRVC
ncbi:hypothetical protein PN497_01575 [Sphaerospermopsis kisseleviana CS-549]|uniref:Uncharacterized protein n=1 Tax=Sphaerospermopsis kisseleviana CS-549 TaxID=3021783 RepID=A0ABT4ZL04_9CYAN|nr:hypothetical protein [Sphaerospermopsis kisseleviana]MDB9440071.1 hypothetical protein [Sphaerospermopsis kisseleviana CS-549]